MPKKPKPGKIQGQPLITTPPDHTVEIPTNWILDQNLKSSLVIILIVILANANSDMTAQISAKQIKRTTRLAFRNVKISMRKLQDLGYLTKLPSQNGYANIYKITLKPKSQKLPKTKKPKK